MGRERRIDPLGRARNPVLVMRRPLGRIGVVVGSWLALTTAGHAASFSDWQHRQTLRIPSSGLVKLSLPIDTLDAARPGLEDLRVVDVSGNEVPYVVERPAPPGERVREARSVQVTLSASATVVTIETGLTERLEGVTLASPATSFVKAVQIEGSVDQKSWRTLARGVPIFRQPNGAGQLRLSVPAGVWPFLRLTVDDRRTPPVPFTGARVTAAAPAPLPAEPVPVRVVARTESPGETRLALDLGGARLHLAALEIESPDPLFTRKLALAARRFEDGVIREAALAHGVIYRIAVEGQPVSAQLRVPLEIETPARELLVLIHNEDSPPLSISAVRAERRPVYLVFLARQAGSYAVLTGNRRATAPRYDVASLGANLRGASASRLHVSPLEANPDLRPGEVLPEIPMTGPALDVSGWVHRKRAQSSRPGVQQLELDLEVLSRAQPDFADLRLMSDGRQVPYILEHTSLTRPVAPELAPADDPRRPRISRWSLRLPHPALPLTRLVCTVRTALFRREMVLSEEVPDDRGERHPRQLGRGAWVQTPDRASRDFGLALTGRPATDTLILETNDGDNPPIQLDRCQLLHPVTRLIFKAAPDTPIHLYYGNPTAAPARYDLGLVAAQLLAADRIDASLRAAEPLLADSWREKARAVGRSGVVFWGVLALVVLGLLIVIARLLPKPGSPPGS